MKRYSQGGSSPTPKYQFLAELASNSSSDEDFPDNIFANLLSQPQSQSSHNSDLPTFKDIVGSSPPSPVSSLPSQLDDDDYFFPEFPTSLDDSPAPPIAQRSSSNSKINADFAAALEEYVSSVGASTAAETIMENTAIKESIVESVLCESHSCLKSSLKKSVLSQSKKNRDYLLTLTPRAICEELQKNSNPAFLLIVKGLLGISRPEAVYDSTLLLNTITLLYSTVGKLINRKATGYALLLTTAARDGGLREDTLRLLCCMVHPRTSQKYDKEVLGEGWDNQLKESLKREKDHFEKQRAAQNNIEKLCNDFGSEDDITAANDYLENLLDTAPPQVQKVWDNLNLRTKHRYQRAADEYSSSNLDWMASLWIQDRIDSNHMENRQGVAVKDVRNLNIKDMVASEKEKDYVFRALIAYYAHRLVTRHPMMFKAIAGCIKPNIPHQFQQAMNTKTTEFTGNLFTKSESSTEDLIRGAFIINMLENIENVNQKPKSILS